MHQPETQSTNGAPSSHGLASVPALTRAGTRESSQRGCSAGGALFAFALFVLSHGWLMLVREVPSGGLALLSYTQEQLCIWGAFLLVDSRLVQRASRFAWAALGTLGVSFILFDGLLLRMTSLPLREILPMLLASQHVVEGLREIGLKPARLALLVFALLLAAGSGGWLRLMLGDWLPSRRAARAVERWGIWSLSVLPLTFVLEQTYSRDHADYLFRSFRIPAYVQLYNTSSSSVVVPLNAPVSHRQRRKWLANVGPAKNPHHVLYILLESFRKDAVDPKVSPNIWALRGQGLSFESALAEATYTPLSWSVLLFDESAQDNLYGRFSARHEPLGGWLLAVMRQAGYQTHVSISTNLTYGHTRRRLLGSKPNQLDLFQAAADVGDDPADKNSNDLHAVDHLVKLIEDHHWDAQPQFMLLQLDSTHYTYPFPEDEAIWKPYSEKLLLPHAIETQHEALLLHNRYRNAVHFVDEQIGRAIAALKRAGIYDDTAIVLTADHGEGLEPGRQGHGAVYEATKRVPLIMKLPGRAPRRLDQLVSHRDILPTLAKYLGIELPTGSTRGVPVDTGATHPVFTLAPSGHYGQLTTSKYVLDLRLRYSPNSVTVTPVELERGGQPVAPLPDGHTWLPTLTRFMHTQPRLQQQANL